MQSYNQGGGNSELQCTCNCQSFWPFFTTFVLLPIYMTVQFQFTRHWLDLLDNVLYDWLFSHPCMQYKYIHYMYIIMNISLYYWLNVSVLFKGISLHAVTAHSVSTSRPLRVIVFWHHHSEVIHVQHRHQNLMNIIMWFI